jgi:putative lipoprotein
MLRRSWAAIASHPTTFFIRTRFYPLACMTLLCTAAGSSFAGTLEGTAYYRERIALPPDAIFEAQLQDISRADASALVLGRARLEPAGELPFRFKISCDEAAVYPRDTLVAYHGR